MNERKSALGDAPPGRLTKRKPDKKGYIQDTCRNGEKQ